MTTAQYIQENNRRKAERNKPYDPIVGTEHSKEMPRVLLCVPDAPITRMMIPAEMDTEPVVQLLRACGTMKKALKVLKKKASDYMELWTEFEKTRCKYDFEFWCSTDVHILHKTKGRIVPFILNLPQRTKYLPVLERLRKAGLPINVDLLKARQWGGSTLTEFYINWIQRFWAENYNSAICADVDDQARGILGMYERASEYMDVRLNDGKPLELKPYMGTDSTRIIESRGCTISVGSAQHPDKIRSQNIRAAHLTEVGLWKDTPKRKAADVVQSFFGSIINMELNVKVLESTAKGVGNFFHRHWLRACDPDDWNGFTPVFVAWFDIEMYSMDIDDVETFIQSMNEYDRYLFMLGATLEGINWYKTTLRTMDEPWRMKSEFPSTPEEAFQSTGRNYFAVEQVEQLRQECCEPRYKGDIIGAATKGKEAMDDVRIIRETNGRLKVWEEPDNSVKMNDRYLVVVDLGKGVTDKADNSVVVVYDRYWQHEAGGMPEVVAEWSGHLDVDLLSWKAAQLAHLYQDALLVIESNTAESSKEDHVRTVLAQIGEHYDNIYRRSKRDPIKGGVDRYGFHTNTSTKYLVCDYLQMALRDGLYIERNQECINEMRVFERKPDGRLGAVDGNHDDRVMTRAIGCYFLFKEGLMPTPKIITEETETFSTVNIGFI